MPADPSPVTSDPSTFGQVNLTWGSVSGVTGYRIYRRRYSVSGTYLLIYEGTDLTYTDIISSYDLDTLGTVAGEVWEYEVYSYDSGGESPGIPISATMTAQTASDITNASINHTPYNDGSDQTASYTITNPDTLTATVSDATKIMHEGRMRAIDAYGRHTSN
jgi:hypothetical protein